MKLAVTIQPDNDATRVMQLLEAVRKAHRDWTVELFSATRFKEEQLPSPFLTLYHETGKRSSRFGLDAMQALEELAKGNQL